MVRIVVPLFYKDKEITFNTMVLVYGGDDPDVNKVDEKTQIVEDENIRNDEENWNSGFPFSIVELPENVTVKD